MERLTSWLSDWMGWEERRWKQEDRFKDQRNNPDKS